VQQQLARRVQLLSAEGEPLGHRVALDQVRGVQDDASGFP
jgi:hypothetical protein